MGTNIDDLIDSVKNNYQKNFGRDATAENLAEHRARLEKNIEKYPRTHGLIPEDSDSAYSQKQLYEMDKNRRAKGNETSDKPVKAPAKPVPRTGGGGGGSSGAAELKSITNPKAMKKGGKVAGRLATRGYGIAKK